MTRRPQLAFAVSLALLGAAACGYIAGKGDAEVVTKELFASLSTKDYERAAGYYSSQFFAQTARPDWIRSLKNVNAKLGDLQRYELETWQVRKQVGVGGSGTVYQLQYKVTYARHLASETLVLFKPLTGGEIKVIGHHINSDGFLK